MHRKLRRGIPGLNGRGRRRVVARDGHARGHLVFGQVVHHIDERGLADGTQAACAGVALDRLVRDGLEGVLLEHELAVFVREHALVLLHQRVARFGQDAHQVVARQAVERPDDRDAADELGDHAELVQVLGKHLVQQRGLFLLLALGHLGGEADGLLAHAVGHDIRQTDECAAQDEQDVRRVDVDELLLRMLAPALRRNGRLAALDDLQQRLLDAFARHVARDGQVLGLAGDLVDLVDVDDADLGAVDIIVGGDDELEQDVLDVFADVARLGERRGIGDGERHLQRACERLGEQGLARAGRPEQQDVALRYLDAVIVDFLDADALVVVVHGHRQETLGLFLAHHVF